MATRTKKCTKCNKNKLFSDFWKGNDQFNLQYKCKSCIKKYAKKNKKKISKYKKQWYIDNIDKKKVYDLKYLEKNREIINKKAKRYREKNKKKISKYFSNRLKNDPIYRLKKNLRTRIGLAIKTNQKKGSMIDHLGCSIEEFKFYLEDQFSKGMNWDNYGEWHIDHIVPLNEATTVEEIYELCHFSNLQPLWAIDNIRKNKYA
jgi:hypothetical protein